MITRKLFIFALIVLSACCGLNTFASEKVNLRVTTFNIRYDNPDDGSNSWKCRKDSVFAYLEKSKPDLIGMQEVLNNQLNDLQAALPNYAYVGVGREDGKTKGEYAPIFYRKDKYELLAGSTFWLSSTPEKVSLGWDAACVRIVTWVKLKDKKSGEEFMMLNTHFDHVGTEARKQSALLIIEKIKEIVGNKPAIVTGDFNVSEQSEAYKTLTNNAFVLKDAWTIAADKKGANYTFHDFGRYPKDKREKIDFIFVTPQITVKKATVKSAALKNNIYLSDHNPHTAYLNF